LSLIPNPVPILSRFECNVTSHVDKVYSYSTDTYNKFIVVRCVLSSSKCNKPYEAYEAYEATPGLLVGWGGDSPYPYTSTPAGPRTLSRISIIVTLLIGWLHNKLNSARHLLSINQSIKTLIQSHVLRANQRRTMPERSFRLSVHLYCRQCQTIWFLSYT